MRTPSDTAPIRPLYGFALSLLTAMLWGLLPVGLLLCLQVMDSPTITFYRFVFAATVVVISLAKSHKLPKKTMLTKHYWLLALVATGLLVTNYVTNVYGLNYLSASSAQVLMQLAPMSLMLGGVLIFKESFSKWQFVGTAILLIGLILFFNQRIPHIIASDNEHPIGLLIITLSALAWGAYALAQKPLFAVLSARQTTLVFYVFGSLMLLPLSQLTSITNLNVVQAFALLFCCLNTLIAYGAFTEAMRVWYTSKVSAVLATQPLFTYLSIHLAQHIAPHTFYQPNLDSLAYFGGSLVVAGSMITALYKPKTKSQG